LSERRRCYWKRQIIGKEERVVVFGGEGLEEVEGDMGEPVRQGGGG